MLAGSNIRIHIINLHHHALRYIFVVPKSLAKKVWSGAWIKHTMR